jgi:DNA-binding transcriptional ArsR family regulator
MRALAHPIRLRMIALLSADGPASVRALAARTGESTASVSYHLAQLARFGLVEEAVELRTGRERPWRAARRGISWDMDHGDDASAAQEQALPGEWQRASFFLDDVGHLTAAELAELSEQLKAVLARVRRPDPQDRPAGAKRISFFAYGLPNDS